MNRIMAFDPGGTTGIAYMVDTKTVGQDQLSGLHHQRLYDRICRFNPEVVVFEEFDYRPAQEHAELISCEYIGVIKLWCIEREISYVGQKSSVGKATGKSAFWTVDKLRRIGLHQPGMPHATDATSHLLHYWSFTLKRQDYLIQLAQSGDFD